MNEQTALLLCGVTKKTSSGNDKINKSRNESVYMKCSYQHHLHELFHPTQESKICLLINELFVAIRSKSIGDGVSD